MPRLTNNSIRPTSIRAMRRGGFERNDVAFVSGHKNLDTLMNYDALTVLDRTKMALAIQKGPATLDGDKVDLDKLARGHKRKSNDPPMIVSNNDNPVTGTSENDNPVPGTSKKVTFDEDDVRGAEFQFVIDNPGLDMSDVTEDISGNTIEVKLPAVNTVHESDDINDLEPALPSSQAHNVAQLIRDQMNTSKELINNYISAMKKK